MTITNLAGLPEPIVEAVRRDPYSSGESDTTVTRLLKPARAVALEKQHADELVEDAGARLWALFGQIGHAILERGSKEVLTERRLFTQMAGWKVSGQVDLIHPKGTQETILTDYKVTSAWSCKEGLKPEWEQQLNMLNLLCSRNDVQVTRMQIVAIFRDWSKLEARRNADYPQVQVKVFDVPMWELIDTERYMAQRVAAHQAAQAGSLPDCLPSERWEKPTKWAVHKDGRERAVKLHDSLEAAQKHLLTLDAKHSIEERPGQQIRCESYCEARPYCTQADSLGVPKE